MLVIKYRTDELNCVARQPRSRLDVTDCTADRPNDRPTDRPIDRPTDRPTDRPAGRPCPASDMRPRRQRGLAMGQVDTSGQTCACRCGVYGFVFAVCSGVWTLVLHGQPIWTVDMSPPTDTGMSMLVRWSRKQTDGRIRMRTCGQGGWTAGRTDGRTDRRERLVGDR